MEHSSELVLELALALAAALAGGWVAKRLGQPVLLGYLIAGIAIGPNTPGFEVDRDQVQQLAELGVALLMFVLGVEFSFSEILRVKGIVSIAGALQISFCIVLGFFAGLALGWTWQASALLGGAFAISSSIVTLTLLGNRGEADSPHGMIALGMGVVQDLSLVPMMAILPVLSGDSDNVLLSVGKSVGIAALALVLVIVLGTRLVPRVLFEVAKTESRQLFLLVVVLIALGTALASEKAGLSLALGAFLAGMVVSESDYDSQVLAEVIPLRDLFSSLFFVSIGMLLDPAYIFHHPLEVGFVIVALIVGKLVIMGGSLLAAKVNYVTATMVAVFMAQMGEFSFVLAGSGRTENIIDSDQFGVILAAAVASMIAMPFLVEAGPRLVSLTAHLPNVAAQERELASEDIEIETPRDHVVISGYGRVGGIVGEALDRRGYSYSVIELNPAIVRDLRDQGIPAIYGDAGSEQVLEKAGIKDAVAFVITSADLVSTPAAIRNARAVNPDIEILTRAKSTSDVEVLRHAGADEIVQPEFEAGLECIRWVMRSIGVSSQEANAMVNRRRLAHYQATSQPEVETTGVGSDEFSPGS